MLGSYRSTLPSFLPASKRPQKPNASKSRQATRCGVAAPERSSHASLFEDVPLQPPDPILGVSEAFKKDTSETKLNLGVGAYRTDSLKPYVLDVVRRAEEKLVELKENKEYLPIEGLAAFNKATAEMLLGRDSTALQEGRVVTLQSLSGTGSLRIAAEFIGKFMPGTSVYLSKPTWGNHKNIFADARVNWEEYRYFNKDTVGLDFEGMLADIKAAPKGSVIVLHGCAHNPTGNDPTPEQWEQVAAAIEECGHIPFFDVAYQGFASGDLDQDAFAPRLFVDRGLEVIVAQSYSKNLGLYAERVGAINFIVGSPEAAKKVLSQLKRIARAIYSNPPVHGARIASLIVGDPKLFEEWNGEMKEMAGRIQGVRKLLREELEKLDSTRDWSFVTSQIGMFSFTGLNAAQVENMTNKHHVFMTKDGRISLAGLPSNKAAFLAEAMIDSYKV